MKIYLASRYSTKEQMKVYRDELRQLGLEVNSRWLEEKYSEKVTLDQVRDEELAEFAEYDVEDILDCDILVLFTIEPTTPGYRGGRHFESGFAYGVGKPILVVGPKENIFHYLPDMWISPTWDEAKIFLQEFNSFLKEAEYGF